jgi:quercetin dioxygenase-like cupin family protein
MDRNKARDMQHHKGHLGMNTPPIVSRQEWEAARQQMLAKEKALMRDRDARGITDRWPGFLDVRMPVLRGRDAHFLEGTMTIIRREFLLCAGAAASAMAVARFAQAQTAAAGPRLTQVLRKDLEAQDQRVEESVVSVVEFGPGIGAPWHMHPGAQEILYTLEGNLTVEIEGQGATTVKSGECSMIPADVPHLARNDGTTAAKALVVHSRSAKDKPLVAPVKRAS